MSEHTGSNAGNPLIVIGYKIQPNPHLVAPLQQLRIETNLLSAWKLIGFKTFFMLCYPTSPEIMSASITFLQQIA